MTVIIAKGKTKYGDLDVRVTGGLFGYDAVTVEGELEEIPGGKEGVLY